MKKPNTEHKLCKPPAIAEKIIQTILSASEKEGIEFLKKTCRTLFPWKVFEYKFYRDDLKEEKMRFELPLKMTGFIALEKF